LDWCLYAPREVGGVFSDAGLLDMPNASIAQRTAWLRLRSLLSKDLLSSKAATSRVSEVLKAFDALPYGLQEPSSLWLPSPTEIKDAFTPFEVTCDATQSLAGAAETEAKFLHTFANKNHSNGSRKIQVSDSREGLLWIGLGTEPCSNPRSSRMSNDAKRRARLAQVRFPLVKDRFDWLRTQHENVARNKNGAHQYCEDTFLLDLFRMLVRYDGLGGGAGGSGNQAAVPAQVFSAFERWAKAEPGSCVEAFASPLNHRLAKQSRGSSPAWFGSAFGDVDSAFGSLGSFLNSKDALLQPSTQSQHHSIFLLNPPFFASHMEAIPGQLHRHFSDLNTDGSKLESFPHHRQPRHSSALVVVPGRGTKQSTAAPHGEMLRKSPWFRGSISLAGGTHGFEHGLQHCRHHKVDGSALRLSFHETEVHVLSTLSPSDIAATQLTTGAFKGLLKDVSACFSVQP